MKKTFYQLVLFLCLVLSLQACGSRGGSDSTNTPADNPPDDGTPTIPVASIQLTADSAAINPGESVDLTVTLLNATGQFVNAPKEVTFSLSAPSLGSINPSVMVSSGVAKQPFTANNIEGIVTITASVDGKSATQQLQISRLVAANTVTVSSNPESISVGGTAVVSATVLAGR